MFASFETRWRAWLLGLMIVFGIMAGAALANSAPAHATAANFAVWDDVAQCESGGNWASTSNEIYDGGLQFDPNTWSAYNGNQYAPTADQATKDQQIAVARRVLAAQGPGAWPTCGAKAGLTRENGGADPNATAGSSEPEYAPAPAETTVPDTHHDQDNTVLVGFGPPPAGGHNQGHGASNFHDFLDSLGINAAPAPEVHTEPAPEVVVPPPPVPAPAPEPQAPSGTLPGGWAAPFDPNDCTPIVTTVFGALDSDHKTPHQGTDLACPMYTKVHSIQDGTVISCGSADGFGQWVRVLGPLGMSVYGHVEDLLCSVGEQVKAGDVIATEGNRGQSTGPHLHLEIHPAGEWGGADNALQYIGDPSTWVQTVIDTVTAAATDILAAAPQNDATTPAPDQHDSSSSQSDAFGAPSDGHNSHGSSHFDDFLASLNTST